MNKEKLKAIWIDPKIHQKLKVKCAENNYNMQFMAERALIELLKMPELWTAQTVKAKK